jgi:hypothetical protein
VRNGAGRRQTGQLGVEPEAGAEPGWFAFEGAAPGAGAEFTQDFEAGATATVRLTVTVPPAAPGGSANFRVRLTAESDPDNDFVQSPAVALTIPPPAVAPQVPKKPFPWWIPAVAAALLLVVGGVVAYFVLFAGPGRPEVAGRSEAEARQILVQAGFPEAGIVSVAGDPTGNAPGTVLAAAYGNGRAVRLTFDPGVAVPAVLGRPVDEAVALLRGAQLAEGARGTVSTPPGSPANVVLAARPAPGARVASGTAVALEISQPQAAPSPGGTSNCSYGPNTCVMGFVWRDARANDQICVTGDVRSQAAADNAAAASRRAGGGPYGPDTCLQGFVWREAFPGDVVCVPPPTRSQAAADNQQHASRIACRN